MPNPVQSSVSLTIGFCVCSPLWIIFIGCSHCSGAPGHVMQGGAPGTFAWERGKPPCLKLPEVTPGSEAPAVLPWGAPHWREGSAPGSGSWSCGNGALHVGIGRLESHLALPLPPKVTRGKLGSLPEPQFPHLDNGGLQQISSPSRSFQL